MADTILVASESEGSGALGSNVIRYIPIGSGFGAPNTTESNIERTWRNAGTLKKLLVLVTSNSILVLDTVYTTRKNQANTSQTVSVPAGSTGTFEDTTNNVTVAATDELDYLADTPVTASGTITATSISNIYTADSNTYTNFQTSHYTSDTSVSYTDNTTRYALIGGFITNESTESNVNTTFKSAGTLKNGFVYITQNNISSASTIRTRKNNTTNGNISISVTGNTTGIFEDSSNTDTVASDDEWNWQIVCPSVTQTKTIEIRHLQIGFETTNSQFPLFSGTSAPKTQAFNATYYYALGSANESNTESHRAVKSRVSFTAKNMVAAVTANTIATSETTFNFRKTNNSVITISVSAGATGIFENTSDTSSVDTTDTINFSVITPNTSGSISFRQISVMADASWMYLPSTPKRNKFNFQDIDEGEEIG